MIDENNATHHISADYEFAFAVEAVLLPAIGFSARNAYRSFAFRDNAFETKRLHLLNGRRQFGAEQRVHSQGVSKMRSDVIKHLFPLA
jgi:hypothetical protein